MRPSWVVPGSPTRPDASLLPVAPIRRARPKSCLVSPSRETRPSRRRFIIEKQTHRINNFKTDPFR